MQKFDEEEMEWIGLLRRKSGQHNSITDQLRKGMWVTKYMCHNLPRIGYKMPYNKVYTKENTMLEEFVNYVDSFYMDRMTHSIL